MTRTVLPLLLALLTLVAAPLRAQTGEQLKIVVLHDEARDYGVALVTQADLGKIGIFGAFGGAIGGAIAGGVIENRNLKLGRELGEKIGDSFDKYPILNQNLEKAFQEKSTRFAVTCLTPAQSAKLLADDDRKPNYATLASQGYDFAIILKESAGFATPAGQLGKLMPASYGQFRVYDLQKKKKIFTGFSMGVAGTVNEWQATLEAPQALFEYYPGAAFQLGTTLYARMLGTDTLHKMAAETSFAEEYPSVKKIFKKYSKSFKLKPAKTNGWKNQFTGNKFIFLTFPKKMNNTLTVATEVDLLIEEVGQDFPNFQDYVQFRLDRVAGSGMHMQTLVDAPKLQLAKDWIGYQVDDPRGGILIILFRQDGPFALSQTISILDPNPQQILTQYQSAIEETINQQTFTYTPSKFPK